jgi:hypothetical protein
MHGIGQYAAVCGLYRKREAQTRRTSLASCVFSATCDDNDCEVHSSKPSISNAQHSRYAL